MKISKKALERVYMMRINEAFEAYLESKEKHDKSFFKNSLILEAVNWLLEQERKIEGHDVEWYQDELEEEQIDDRLFYISDRWCSVGRLNFLKNRVILSK